MTVQYKRMRKPEAYDVLCFFMERGETIEEIVAAIPFYDHTGNRVDAAHVRWLYEEEKRLREQAAQ